MATKKKRARNAIRKPPELFEKTQKVVAQIEKTIGQPLITYWNSPSGSVCNNDVVGFYELLQKIGRKKRVALFLKSEGGNGQASLRIVHLLRQFTGQLTALVPLECASAATMLALGADEIRMGPMAFLSAVDTSLTHELSPIDNDNSRVSVELDELKRVLEAWKREGTDNDRNPYETLYQYVHPLVIGAVDRSSSLSVRLCTEILAYHMKNQRKIKQIAKRLNSDYPSHGFPITILEAERIGLNVNPLEPDLNDSLIELNELYAEMGQRAITDYDELNYHDNETLNILEARDIQVYYQSDKDWHYRSEERRWVPLNDKSSWRRIEKTKGRVKRSIFHIR